MNGKFVRCRGCHKPIRMVATEKGRRMPIDPDPAGRSKGLKREAFTAAMPTLVIRNGSVHVLRPDEPWDGDLYPSHFVTCREARRFRRRVLRAAADAARSRVLDGLDEID